MKQSSIKSSKTIAYQKYLERAQKKGYSLRYAKELVEHLGKIPTLKQLENYMNSNFGRDFKAHYGTPKEPSPKRVIINTIKALQVKNKNNAIKLLDVLFNELGITGTKKSKMKKEILLILGMS